MVRTRDRLRRVDGREGSPESPRVPRIPQLDVERREQWVIDLFKQEPTLSVPEVNYRLRQTFGATMNQKRLYALRAQVTGQLQRKRQPDATQKARAALRKAVRALQAEMAARGIERMDVPVKGPPLALFRTMRKLKL